MPGALAWGYYPTDKIWLPIQVDANGRLKADMSAINLGDLADVDLTGLADDDFMYYDQATGLWKPRKLVDADIPATICRDSELAYHETLPDVHHATHLKTLANHPLSIIPTMDDDHIPAAIARDTEVATAVSDHAGLTTGIHGAGSNHLALFPVASTIVTKFTPLSTATYLWRGGGDACDSSFEALINGAPSATSVVYDNDVREASLPNIAGFPQWGKVILHNITRGNSRKITNFNAATNTITTESSSDNWANNDIITIGSQTCLLIATYTYSRFFDVDISPYVPATATVVLLQIFNTEASGASTGLQNSFGCHPFETYGVSKFAREYAGAAYQVASMSIIVPVVSQKICIAMGAYSSVNAAGMHAWVAIRGYWE